SASTLSFEEEKLIRSFHEQSDSVDSEFDDLLNANIKLEEKLFKVQGEVNSIESGNAELKSEISVLHEQVIDIRRKLNEQALYRTEFETWLTNFNRQTTNFDNCLAEARKMLETKATQTEQLKSIIKELNQRLDIMQHNHSLRYIKHEQDKHSLRNQVEELRRQKANLEQEKTHWVSPTTSELATSSAFLSPIPQHLQVSPKSKHSHHVSRSSHSKSPVRIGDRKQLVHSAVVFVFGFLSAIILHQSGVLERSLNDDASSLPSRSGSLTGGEPVYINSREQSQTRSINYLSNEIPDDIEDSLLIALPGRWNQNNSSVPDNYFKPF
ncbi:hypothetical protein HK096_009287, partial [Nowakowskiella sp. JEL0078]